MLINNIIIITIIITTIIIIIIPVWGSHNIENKPEQSGVPKPPTHPRIRSYTEVFWG